MATLPQGWEGWEGREGREGWEKDGNVRKLIASHSCKDLIHKLEVPSTPVLTGSWQVFGFFCRPGGKNDCQNVVMVIAIAIVWTTVIRISVQEHTNKKLI